MCSRWTIYSCSTPIPSKFGTILVIHLTRHPISMTKFYSSWRLNLEFSWWDTWEVFIQAIFGNFWLEQKDHLLNRCLLSSILIQIIINHMFPSLFICNPKFKEDSVYSSRKPRFFVPLTCRRECNYNRGPSRRPYNIRLY